MALPPALVDLQRHNNRQSAERWAHFAEHRAAVTGLALEASHGGTLAVLGAGNGNDLDLAALAGRFERIHLADLDDEALARARARQPAEVAARLVLHAPVDLGGALGLLPTLARRPPGDAEIAALPAAAAEAVLAALPGPFDVVLSTCLLSQLLHACAVALGPEHPRLTAISCALVLAHVRALVLLLRPGGAALLVTDVASSQSLPLQKLWAEFEPVKLVHALERGHFTASGTGPAFLRRLYADDRVLGPLLAGPPRLHRPWLWHFGAEITYLVTAWELRRH